jgi:hypothetical protein
MRRLTLAILLVAFVEAGPRQGYADQVKVNISYPIDGATYPKTGPAPGPLSSLYFTSSFSVTCGGGPHKVEWGFDTAAGLGSVSFYDQMNLEFVHKLPGGSQDRQLIRGHSLMDLPR